MKYFLNFFNTGAIRKTPPRIIKKILSEIEIKNKNRFIELGAGKGEITKQIVAVTAQKSENEYYAFEIDKNFSEGMQAVFPAIHIINKDAFEFENFIPPGFLADYIISSMPLSFYPKEKIAGLLKKMEQTLHTNGKIIILFHAFWLIPILKKELPHSKVYRFNTIPPYFLSVFKKVKK